MKFISILFLIVSFSLNAKAEVINNVIVNNNDRISLNTIKTYGNIEIGSDYSSDDLNNILKNLYETNYFQDVSLKIENNALVIDVVENKLIQIININGIKSSRIQDAILESLNLRTKAPFIESQVEQDLIKIKSALNIEGYYYSNVTSDVEFNLNNTVNLNFNIDLGDKVKISKIEFTGDKIVKDKTLRNLITIEESKFWKFLSKKKYLNQQSLLRDERLLKKYYLDEGYYDVVVNASTAILLDNNSFNVTFNINAGNVYKVNDTKLVLPIDYDIKNFQVINELLKEIKSENYSFFKISKIVNAIDKISLSREYDFITAEIIEDKVSTDKINITFKVSETEKLYVEEINILGNNITEEIVVRNQLEVDEGDPFNELLQAKGLNQIRSLGIFKTVTSEILDGSNPSTKVINIRVEEKPTGEISLGAGVGSEGGTIGFSVKENNFLGKGVKLSSSLRLSGEAIRGNFTVNNPDFNYSGRALYTNIESSKTDKLDTSGYELSKTGLSLGTSFEEYENLYFSPKLSLFAETLDTNSTASTAMKKQNGSSLDTKFSYSLDYDLRDKPYQTTDGVRSLFSQSIPLYSDDLAFSNSYEITKWHQFDNKMISDLGFYVNVINSLNGDDVKVSNRLSLPKQKLRGFERGKVGPVDNKDYIGGNYAMSLNFNTTLPMLLPNFENVDFKYFFDIANLWGVDYSDTVDNSSNIRSSTGISVDWFTPVGPLNFSLSQNLSKASTDVTEKFQFNLGTTF
jgi:outer membrane protein insertion porin family